MKNLITTILFFMIASFAIAQGSFDSGLVAFYPFNGNANDESGYGNNGSLINGVSFDNDRWNNPNQAIRFNKSLSQYVDVQNSPSLQIDSAISFSFWAKRNTLDNGQDQVLNKGGDWMNGTCNYGLVFSEGTLVFMHSGGYYIVGSPGVPLDSNWHHYAVTASEGTTEMHFYVDGVEKTSLVGAGNPLVDLNPTSSSDLYLGGVNYFSNNTMDELKIYNRILSEDEIKSLYSNLVAYYPFNGNANDESGNGFNGSVSGATLTTDRFNQADKAYSFVYNGFSSDKIQVSGTSGLNFSTGGFSLSAWIKFSGTAGAGNNYPIISKHICGEQSGYILMLYNGKLTFWLAGASGYNILSTSADYNDETWHQVVAVYDDVNQYIYVDGVLKNSIAFDYNVYNSADWALGGYNGCNGGFNGKVDEVKIYNRPLGAAEILEEYNNTVNDLVLFLPFNGNADDESGSGNNGTAVGASLTYDRYGNTDNAYNFNGVSDNIYVPDNSIYDFDFGDFTISSWINISSISTARIVSAGFDANDNIWGLGFGTNPVWGTSKRINYFVYSNNNYRDFSSNEITDYSTGTWTFITATKINDQIRFYQDGLPVGESTINYPSNSNSYMSIGCRQRNSNMLDEFLNGKIDEVKIYTTSFTDEQIRAMYLSSTTAPVLILPINNSAIDTLQPTFDWDSTVTATYYNIVVSTDSTFTTLILDQNSSSSSYQIGYGLLQPMKYFWKVRTINEGGIGPWSEVYSFIIIITDVENETQLPTEFALMQNYPNPFNPSTTITYHLPKNANVELKVYDVIGNEIATLVNEEKAPGIYDTEFNPASSIKNPASGIYFYQLKAGDFIHTKKMILIK